MWVDEDNFSFNELIKQTITRHLKLDSHWYGNPKDSSFGICLNFTWDGTPFGSTVVNFFDENSNENL